jgi:hypothetical protein
VHAFVKKGHANRQKDTGSQSGLCVSACFFLFFRFFFQSWHVIFYYFLVNNEHGMMDVKSIEYIYYLVQS